MRVVIIGGSGHVGTYLVPRLAEAGHEIINVTRGQRQPYQPHAAWASVQAVYADRDAEEAAGTFGERIASLAPDAVIDLICFTLPGAQQMVNALRGKIAHFLHCGTLWSHGHSTTVPASESQARAPFGAYGIQKNAIENTLLDEARRGNFPATVLMPGHIVGPGWIPVNPQGNFNLKVFETLARGDTLALPNLGLETVHHVHADDVAQAFMGALEHWSASVGENFHTVSAQALTLRGYAEAVAGWFGQPARLEFLPWNGWHATVPAEDAAATWDHIAHSPNASIRKAQQLLGYQPRYSSLQAVDESLQWLIARGQVNVRGPQAERSVK